MTTHQVGAEHTSALRFERIWVREASFVDLLEEQQAPSQDTISRLEITLEVRRTIHDGGRKANVLLRALVTPPVGQRLFTSLSAAVEGLFSVGQDVEHAKFDTFTTVQAPVLLLPYLRQVITTLTAQSRVGGIVLPPLNMTALTGRMAQAESQSTPANKG